MGCRPLSTLHSLNEKFAWLRWGLAAVVQVLAKKHVIPASQKDRQFPTNIKYTLSYVRRAGYLVSGI